MTEVATGEYLNGAHNDITDKLNMVALLPREQVDERLAMEAYEALIAPERRLPQLVDGLSEVYQDRAMHQRMQRGYNTEEVTQFATRNRTDEYLQELYTVVDTYGPLNKGWLSRHYILDRFDFDSDPSNPTHIKICISPDIGAQVYRYGSDGQREMLKGDEAYTVMGTFVSEALLSASLMADESLAGQETAIPVRTRKQREIANADAKQKLVVYHTELEQAVHEINDLRTDEGQAKLHRHYMSQPDWMR